MTSKKRITVFTPTYNRAYIMNRLYESLKRQTDQSFIWLIVDDGSTDNTEELVYMWMSENIIEISYIKQKNGGKQRAHNKGVELCDTELFICVDSDDYLTDNAIECFLKKWDTIKDNEKVSGIVALRGISPNKPIGSYLPKGIEFSTLSDLYRKYKFNGDTALLYRSDILKAFPFYVADNEKFIGESYVYMQIDQKYTLCLLNKILYICEYLPDGYTLNVRKLIKDNPRGYMILNRQAVVYSKSLKEKYLNTIRFLIGCILCKEQHPFLNAPNKLLAILSYIPAKILVWKWYK